ncbi:MAG: hypothetical protein BWY77_00580 [bacterium ADurb.Bin431]|nr:MAG: hypothetical protein BWY77_00580 [bacterium ADurb.Bin431]
MLALVFVDALGLDIEKGIGGDLDAGNLADAFGEPFFIFELDPTPLLAELSIAGKGFELAQLLQIPDPTAADPAADQPAQPRITQRHPAAGCHPVGHIEKTFGPELIKIMQHSALEQITVHPRHPVHRMAADAGKMSHTQEASARFVNQGEPFRPLLFAGMAFPDLVQKAAVDLEDNLEMAGQQIPEKFERPALQGLGQKGVVGIAEGASGDLPGAFPLHAMHIHQQAHQLRHRDGGMGVIHLDRKMVGKVIQIGVP